MKPCKICKRKNVIGLGNLWILSHMGLESITVCDECSLCLENQFLMIAEELKLKYIDEINK